MYAEITAAIQSVKTVAELAKAANTLSNHNELILAVADVNSKLMDATAVALASQEKHSELLNRISELERENMSLKREQARAARYELHQFPTGTLVYKLKDGADEGEPMHYLCTKCVDSGGHAKLQPWGSRKLKCVSCGTVFSIALEPPAESHGIIRRSSGFR